MRKNVSKKLQLSRETMIRLDLVSGGTWSSSSEEPVTKAFTGCPYCGPVHTIAPSSAEIC
jgi:hypothetical protein